MSDSAISRVLCGALPASVRLTRFAFSLTFAIRLRQFCFRYHFLPFPSALLSVSSDILTSRAGEVWCRVAPCPLRKLLRKSQLICVLPFEQRLRKISASVICEVEFGW